MGTWAIRDEYMACPLPFARFLRWPPDAPRGNGAIAHLDERRYNHQPSHAKKNNVSEMERRMGHKKGSADPMPAHPPSGRLPVPPLAEGGRRWPLAPGLVHAMESREKHMLLFLGSPDFA